MRERLFPINRSLTGDGVRESLKILQETADFDIKEISTGTKIFDWEVPKEWNIKGAKLESRLGVHADFKDTNLRVVGYSQPVDRELSYYQLQDHVHSDPQHPSAIPYRTSYYKKDWGFCMTEKERNGLNKGINYNVNIDSKLEVGSMTYGEFVIPGKTGKEYLVTSYSCHPSMYQDNVSGMVVWAKLLAEMQKEKTQHGYHFFIGPETIGVLSLLQRKSRFDGAMVINCVGRNEPFVMKKSYLGNSEIDNVAEQTFKEMEINYKTTPFSVNGSDERQLQSPAFRIPTINITRGGYYGTDWYHNSRDSIYTNVLNKTAKHSESALDQSVDLYHNVLENLDRNRKIYSLNPHGEPMLSKRNLYSSTGGSNERDDTSTIAKWLMHEDGSSIVDVARKTGYAIGKISEVYDKLRRGGLLK